ncbi:MAG: helix-turn-helix domain-containing protein [Actinobacteria bacterium]|nr:helix-turn-helix domain-containing protein [Actinomycetota bacterium]MCA1720798.1 helix-turn-helix domain-containing protein [Actinomycetota bacterium]
MLHDDPDWTAYRTAVGDRLRAARLRANLTQEELAEKASVSRNVVQRLERGDPQSPRLGALYLLARAVGVPLGELVAGPT